MAKSLPPRIIHRYRRLARPLAALMKLTRGKPGGPLGAATIATCNRIISDANIVFSREPDIASLPLLAADVPLTLADLTLLTDELMVVALRFEDAHPELETPDGA